MDRKAAGQRTKVRTWPEALQPPRSNGVAESGLAWPRPVLGKHFECLWGKQGRRVSVSRKHASDGATGALKRVESFGKHL